MFASDTPAVQPQAAGLSICPSQDVVEAAQKKLLDAVEASQSFEEIAQAHEARTLRQIGFTGFLSACL